MSTYSDKDFELSGDYSSKRSSNAEQDQEQEQSLLGGWKDHSTEELVSESHKGRRPKNRKTWAFVAAAVAAGGLILVGTLLGLRRATGSHRYQDERVSIQTNDYLLSPRWDFRASPQRREYAWFVLSITNSIAHIPNLDRCQNGSKDVDGLETLPIPDNCLTIQIFELVGRM